MLSEILKGEYMNKKDFAKELAVKADLSQKDATAILNDILDMIQSLLEKGEDVDFAGFGKFEVKERAARTGLNPRTKEPVEIPAKKRVVFSAKKALKEAVEGSANPQE
ncbi:HU family DNA-binding protein [Ileibacterium valens]|nr:HU family DNA-binding protein [Ileibacterium valens]